jgi:serine/threonine-protein kinase RsbW
VRTRVAASTLVGAALVVLVVIASLAVAGLVWARADDRARVDDDRAAETAREALQNSLGRVVTSLRAATGLVDEQGELDRAGFEAFARAVSSIPATSGLALEEVVTAAERPGFEAANLRRITEFVRPGVFRPAAERESYLPVVAVWPDTEESRAVLGLDLMSEATRRRAVERAIASGDTTLSQLVPLALERKGLLAFEPLYAPGVAGGKPVGFVSASFNTAVIADVLAELPLDFRVRVMADGTEVYATDPPPGEGSTRTLMLGGRRWTVTARDRGPSHTASWAILVAGLGLAGLLGAFTLSRASFERRLVEASTAERESRKRSELLERNAAHLAAAVTVAEVAASTVADLEAFGADAVFVWRASDPSQLELLASSSVPPETRRRFETYRLEERGLVSDAMGSGRLEAVSKGDEFDARYPNIADERHRLGVESLVAVPLRAANASVVGAVFAASAQRGWLDGDHRQLLLGVAEQTGVALERATLFETEREARRLAELLEQNAAHLAAALTVGDVAASTVGDLEGAGFDIAVVHMRNRGGIELLAAAGVPQTALDVVATLSPIDEDTLVAETIRSGRVVEARTGEELDARYPAFAALRRRLGAEGLMAVPLRATDRRVIGALSVGSPRPSPLSSSRRQVVFGVAEQCGVALERAQLQAEADRTAAATAFLALLGETLERATTVRTRARRLVEILTDEHATFAAVHLLEEADGVELVESSGSRPVEIIEDERWAEHVGRAIATGRMVVPESGNGDTVAGTPSLFVLPLRARGHHLGALTLRAAADAHWVPAIDAGLARELAARAAIALDNARLYERERDVSHALQLGLLGGGPPTFDRVVVAAAYRPGTAALEVGGDWYDAFRLPSGSLAFVVGDVVGHGLEAAVAMGQLRGAVSALAQTTGPALLLERLDSFVETVPSAATATIAYADLDAATGLMRYACAGHPPPLVVSPDGRTRFLWDGRSAPLGSSMGDVRREAAEQLEEGETLVLYTDGLVERRGRSIDEGLARLARIARLSSLGAPALADAICDDLIDSQSQDDDVCVLTVHRIPVEVMFSHAFPASPAELALLRERLRSWLDEHGVETNVERSVVLAVSEAASNAVEHGYGCDADGIVTVMARLDDERLEVTVRDEGKWREGQSDTHRGRGLSIMRAIVDELSIARENGATVLRMSRAAREVPSA